MAFVTLTKEQFEGMLPAGMWREVGGERAQERIYDIKTDRPHLMVRVYSTVDKRTNVTRPHGADAIRIVFWDDLNDRPLGKGKKILRTEGRTRIDDRIASRLQEFLATANDQIIVDFGYVKAVLKHEAVNWMEFAQNMFESLNERGTLTDNQLAYVLGETNPKGKLTFEARVLNADSHFKDNYLNGLFVQETTHENYDQQEASIPVAEEPAPSASPETPPEVVPVRSYPSTEIELDRLVATTSYTAWNYPFPTFNPVQSVVLARKDDDINVVISASTSAGKTICAEFYMDSTMAAGKTVIYMSPLKSLTQEKFTDWEVRYPNKKITILTGDYTLSEGLKAELNDSDIIVMTSEMVDSRTRRMLAEKNYWLKRVGLLIVDEAHILTTERGHAVETGIMRFTKINNEARVLLLSATMPNVDQLGDWLTRLNGKFTQVWKSTWRPVQLSTNYLEYAVDFYAPGRENYWVNQQRKIAMAVDTVMSKPTEKFLVFVHDKGTGRAIVKALETAGERALFHNANLDLEERKEIEDSFRSRAVGSLRVLISTSTLAWGSIVEGSMVKLSNGTNVPVEKLCCNDSVLTYNETTGNLEPNHIIATRKYEPIEEFRITLEDGRVITVDRKHPFYVRTGNGIVTKEAAELVEDDDIVTFEEF